MKRETNPVPALRTKGLREYHSYDGWLKAVNRINPRATMGKAGGVIQAEGIGIWNGQQGFVLPSFDRMKIGGAVKRVPKHKRSVNPQSRNSNVDLFEQYTAELEHDYAPKDLMNFWFKHQRGRGAKELGFMGTGARTMVAALANFASNVSVAKSARMRGNIETAMEYERIADTIYADHGAGGRKTNPAASPALGMSKKAYVNRKSQITKAKPDPRLKKRRNYAYLMAQRGFKGAFPNPIGESKWQWLDYDVWGNAEDGYQVNQAFRTTHKVMLKDDATLPDMLKALRASGVLGSKATTKSVYRETHEDATYFYAFEDDYPLGELQRVK